MSGIWWLALYPSAAVIAVYMWICGKKRSYLDGVAAVQANSDDIESVGTCVHSVCIMTDPWTTAEMMKRFKATFLDHPRFARFKSLLKRRPLLWSYWEEQDEIDISRHFVPHTRPTTWSDLQDELGDHLSVGLDPSRPLWQIHVYEQYEGQNGEGVKKTAMIFKFHHALADGFTIMSTMLQGCSPRHPPARAASKRKRAKPSLLTKAGMLVSATLKLLAMQDDPPTWLKQKTHLKIEDKRNVAFFTLGASVQDIKDACKAAAGNYTINDFVLSAVAGALRAAKADSGNGAGESKDGEEKIVDPTAVMWASLDGTLTQSAAFAAKRDAARWGDKSLAAVYTPLPLSTPTIMGRLAAIQASIKKLVGSPEPLVANFLMAIFGWIPAPLCRIVWPFLAYKVTLSLSNIPGPHYQLKWLPSNADDDTKDDGNPMETLSFLVPPQGTLGLFMCVLSYNDTITFATATDDRVMDRDALRKFVHERIPEEVNAMLAVLAESKEE